MGKGLLADTIGLPRTGRRFPVMSYTPDREELRKKITTLAVEGERLVLLDNLAGAVGNDVLDMALTADRWKDRVLGTNRVYDGPLHVCRYATGNNVRLHADTARRACHVRVESADERPEPKADFKYPDLRAHLRSRRGPLLSAALTVLRGWVVAGRPRHGLPAWGSFEGWSAVIRKAVVFAGLSDPGDTRLALPTAADRDAAVMSAVLDGLERMDPGGRAGGDGGRGGRAGQAGRRPAGGLARRPQGGGRGIVQQARQPGPGRPVSALRPAELRRPDAGHRRGRPDQDEPVGGPPGGAGAGRNPAGISGISGGSPGCRRCRSNPGRDDGGVTGPAPEAVPQ
ncbi:MAG: hypothetical protein K2X87_16915 [Gemmataceae bacterium]|nr:hypothetical protein [Gemmataceae bacterium]